MHPNQKLYDNLQNAVIRAVTKYAKAEREKPFTIARDIMTGTVGEWAPSTKEDSFAYLQSQLDLAGVDDTQRKCVNYRFEFIWADPAWKQRLTEAEFLDGW